MKHPFKLSKSNIIYAALVCLIIIFFKSKIYGFDGFALAYSLGSFIGVIIISTLFALLFWFILGKKENGGTTTFNLVLTFMLLSSLGQIARLAKEHQKPIANVEKAVSEYKEKTLANPDSTDENYSELSTTIKKSINELLKTSNGEERKLYLALNEYFQKSDSLNVDWNNAYNEFAEPRILDFTRLNKKDEFIFQKKVIQKYIDKSENFKLFMQKRVEYLKNLAKNIDRDNKVYKGFLKGLTKTDSIQTPIFVTYINAHIDYGKAIKGIVELLEKENGKWEYVNESIKFRNLESQINYEKILDDVIQNEEIINEFSDKLIETM
jgi:hypothetical protein